ncbi:pyrolysin [Thermococcus sp. 18S1]|uniref:pyrolysin n=1 Tax=Thermococcus sp. 18S1 TaxID=1638210 RepID=UPI001438CE89|nr:pyrolysin [Thermococcus sp. 18S1]NJE31044.1 pyrolysin [Thermococcus sp. 18S1]
MKRVAALLAVLMVALVPFAGAAGATTWSYKNFIKQSVAWYYLYQDKERSFNELYNLSVQMNVSNETLTLALELYNNATAQYNQALTYGLPRDTRTLSWVVFSVHIRKAYLYASQAVDVLEQALKELESQNA